MSKRTSILERYYNKLERVLFHRYLLVREFISLTLFFLGAVVFFTYAQNHGDLSKFVVLFVIFAIIFFAIFTGTVFIKKTIQLVNFAKGNVSILISVGSVFGIISPLFYTNLLFSMVAKILFSMANYNTFFCQVRLTLLDFYYKNNLYSLGWDVIKFVIAASILLFFFGTIAEKIKTRE